MNVTAIIDSLRLLQKIKSLQILNQQIMKIKQIQALKNQIKAEIVAMRLLKYSSEPPIFIYQMGKVGSMTVFKSIKELSLPNQVLHLHFLSDDLPQHREVHRDAGIFPMHFHIVLGEAIHKVLSKKPQINCKIISLVRDPIAFVVSNLFENPYFVKENIKTKDNTIDPYKASQYLEKKLSGNDAFKYINCWFDRELNRVFDIDVFAEPFPVDIGYNIYKNSHSEALIIRTEDLSQKGPSAIGNFLGLEKPLNIVHTNIRSHSREKKNYHQVVRNLKLSKSLCRKLYSGRFAKHFYSESMIENFISKWTN